MYRNEGFIIKMPQRAHKPRKAAVPPPEKVLPKFEHENTGYQHETMDQVKKNGAGSSRKKNNQPSIPSARAQKFNDYRVEIAEGREVWESLYSSRAEKHHAYRIATAEGRELLENSHSDKNFNEKEKKEAVNKRYIQAKIKDEKKRQEHLAVELQRIAFANRDSVTGQIKRELNNGNFSMQGLSVTTTVIFIQELLLKACEGKINEFGPFLEKICMHNQFPTQLKESYLAKERSLLCDTVYRVFSLTRLEAPHSRAEYLGKDNALQENIGFLLNCLNKKSRENLCLVILALTQVSLESPRSFENIKGFVKQILSTHFKLVYKLYQESATTPPGKLVLSYQKQVDERDEKTYPLNQALRAYWQIHYGLGFYTGPSLELINNNNVKQSLLILIVERSRAGKWILFQSTAPFSPMEPFPFDHPIFGDHPIISAKRPIPAKQDDTIFDHEFEHDPKKSGTLHRASITIGHALQEQQKIRIVSAEKTTKRRPYPNNNRPTYEAPSKHGRGHAQQQLIEELDCFENPGWEDETVNVERDEISPVLSGFTFFKRSNTNESDGCEEMSSSLNFDY